MHTLITDGGNRSDITYGSYKIFSDDGTQIAHRQVVFGHGTSNLAEFLGHRGHATSPCGGLGKCTICEALAE